MKFGHMGEYITDSSVWLVLTGSWLVCPAPECTPCTYDISMLLHNGLGNVLNSRSRRVLSVGCCGTACPTARVSAADFGPVYVVMSCLAAVVTDMLPEQALMNKLCDER